MAIVQMRVYREQLDRGHSKFLHVRDDRIRYHPAVRPLAVLGDAGMQLRQPLDVCLVNQSLVPGRARTPVVAPGERGIDDDP